MVPTKNSTNSMGGAWVPGPDLRLVENEKIYRENKEIDRENEKEFINMFEGLLIEVNGAGEKIDAQ